jgi:hypothetical protein
VVAIAVTVPRIKPITVPILIAATVTVAIAGGVPRLVTIII